MKIIKEKLCVEELTSLIQGKTIDFLDLEDEKIKIKISGEQFKDDIAFKFMARILQYDYNRFMLMMNILERYDNEAYWKRIKVIKNDLGKCR